MTTTLTWLGGNPGDGWYEMTSRWIGLLNAEPSAVHLLLEAGGGEQNLASVAAGQGQLGLSIDVVVAAAYNGGGPFEYPMSTLRCLGTGWSALPYNLLAAQDGPTDFAQAIKERRVRVGAPPKDTTDELMFQQVLAYSDTTYDDITAGGGRVVLAGYHDLVDALHDGEIDFVFGATTLPAPSIAQASRGPRAVRLTSLPEDVIDHLGRRFGTRAGIIPADTYPGLQDGDVSTCFVDTVIVASAELDDDVAFEVTRLILANLEHLSDIHPSLAGFNPALAWRNVPAPVHPGAARAYREAGYLG